MTRTALKRPENLVGMSACNCTSTQLSYQRGGAIQGIKRRFRIGTALKTERRTAFQVVSFRRAAYPNGVECSRLQKNFGCFGTHTGVQTSINAGHTQRSFGIANHQVAGFQGQRLPIECGKWSSACAASHNNFPTSYFPMVESMQGLSGFVQYKIGHINHRIYRAEANAQQQIFHPIGAFAHLHTRNP